MPIYRFRCRACNNEFRELVQSYPATVRCPKCGELTSDRKFSAPRGFILNGDGFYKTKKRNNTTAGVEDG